MNRLGRVAVLCLCVVGLSLNASAQTAMVTGRVMDAQSMAVAGAAVSLVANDRRAMDTRTAADGTFSFADVAPGRYTLRVTASGFTTWSQTVVASATASAVMVTLQVAGLNES